LVNNNPLGEIISAVQKPPKETIASFKLGFFGLYNSLCDNSSPRAFICAWLLLIVNGRYIPSSALPIKVIRATKNRINFFIGLFLFCFFEKQK
jgi:hypothetical protein